MKKTLFALAAGVAVAGCCSICCGDKPYPENIEEGFVSLFNGKDLTGWTGATGMYGVETIKVKMRGTQRNMKRQNGIFPGSNTKLKSDISTGQLQSDLVALSILHDRVILEIIDKKETALILDADGETKGFRVAGLEDF